MAPPCCVRPGCSFPVRRSFGQSQPGYRGFRIIDGIRWRWFCSATCASQQRAAEGRYNTKQATQANVRKQEQRTLQRLIEACRPHLDEHGKVDPRLLVRAMMGELRKQYVRQYHGRRFLRD